MIISEHVTGDVPRQTTGRRGLLERGSGSERRTSRVQDIPDAAGTIGEAARVLKPRGRLVALFSHPCFDVPEASAWVAEHVPYRTTWWCKVTRYREVFDVPFAWKLPSGSEVVTRSYHRPLSWYFRVLRGAGFVVFGLEEPAPTKEFARAEAGDTWPDTPFLEQIPLHCIIDACKMNGN